MRPVSGAPRRAAETPNPLMNVSSNSASAMSRADRPSKQQGIGKHPGRARSARKRAAGCALVMAERRAKLGSVKAKVYAYAKCSTCRKALAFLKGKSVPVETVDIVTEPPSKAELERIQKLAGLPVKKLFNTS